MEELKFARLRNCIDTTMNWIACRVFKSHTWSWKLIRGESITSQVPSRAICKHCNVVKGDLESSNT